MLLSLLLSLVCFWPPAAVASICDPVEEGRSVTLTCEFNTTECSGDQFVLWRTDGPSNNDSLRCSKDGCDRYDSFFSPTVGQANATGFFSTLTISAVHRFMPFNMNRKWTCEPCGKGRVLTVCDKLQIYVKPFVQRCHVVESVETVSLSCASKFGYPGPKCSFYRIKNDDSRVKMTKNITYYKPSTDRASPLWCSTSVSVQELGEGTHRFIANVYPDLADGQSLVTDLALDKNVTFSFSQVSHTCTTPAVQGYVVGKSSICTCNISSAGNPRGTARWRDKAYSTVGSEETLNVTFDKQEDEQIYTCEAESPLGRKVGSTLKIKFAFLDPDSVHISSVNNRLDDKHNSTNNSILINVTRNSSIQVQVMCRISKENVSPAPVFSFSRDGLLFENPQPGTESGDGVHNQRLFTFSYDFGKKNEVFCRVTNTILNTSQVAFEQIQVVPVDPTTKEEEKDGEDQVETKTTFRLWKVISIAIGILAIILFVIVIFLLSRIQNLRRTSPKSTTGLYLTPIDAPDIVNNGQSRETQEIPRSGEYEYVDELPSAAYLRPISAGDPPTSRQERDTNSTPAAALHTITISASDPPRPRQDRDTNRWPPSPHTARLNTTAGHSPYTVYYETIPDVAPLSGQYDLTQIQSIEPPNIYKRFIPATSSTSSQVPPASYTNISEHQE